MTIDEIHKHSIHNRDEVRQSASCGCFCCKRVFPVSEIKEWIDGGTTALCPYCGVDAVIGNASSFHLTPALLKELHKTFF